MANTRNPLNGVDFISSLPDEILLIILSKLNTTEQARTAILSHRWTNLWTFTTDCLTIDAADFIRQSETKCRIMILKFTNSVDQIMRMQRGEIISQFKLIYPDDVYRIPGDHLKLDSWIDIAKQKQVKALHLDFKQHRVPLFSLGSKTFSSLVTVTLKSALISDEIIHGLLFNSPNLLELSIISSTGYLEHLSISASSLKLKHLELLDNWIDFLEISAPNLVSFSYSTLLDLGSWPKKIWFNNIPLLTQLSCSLRLISHTWYDFYDLLPQLVTFTLAFSKYSEEEDIPNFPMLTNLKQMHLRMRFNKDDNRLLHLLVGLFRASPCLCSLVLDLQSCTWRHDFSENFVGHKFLKEIEINNFRGFEYEVELLTCIAESCSMLQKIIIHPSSNERTGERESIKTVVNQLATRLPQKKLEIVFKSRNDPDTNRY